MMAKFSMTSQWWTLLGIAVMLLCVRRTKP